MKSFKSFILEMKKKGEKEPPSIPHPIHFKHISSEEMDKKHQTPDPIHFKHIPSKNKQKKLDENASKHDSEYETNFLDKNNNEHLCNKESILDSSDQISARLRSEHPDVSKEHRGILNYYTDSSSELNNSLLNKNSVSPAAAEVHQKTASILDKIIKKHPIHSELNTYSGVGFDPRDHLDEKGTMHSPAFISTTHDPRTAEHFSQSKFVDRARGGGDSNEARHIIHFHLKPGDPATHIGTLSYYPTEHETLIGRGVKLEHLGTTEYDDSAFGKTVHGRTHGKVIIHHMRIHRPEE